MVARLALKNRSLAQRCQTRQTSGVNAVRFLSVMALACVGMAACVEDDQTAAGSTPITVIPELVLRHQYVLREAGIVLEEATAVGSTAVLRSGDEVMQEAEQPLVFRTRAGAPVRWILPADVDSAWLDVAFTPVEGGIQSMRGHTLVLRGTIARSVSLGGVGTASNDPDPSPADGDPDPSPADGDPDPSPAGSDDASNDPDPSPTDGDPDPSPADGSDEASNDPDPSPADGDPDPSPADDSNDGDTNNDPDPSPAGEPDPSPAKGVEGQTVGHNKPMMVHNKPKRATLSSTTSGRQSFVLFVDTPFALSAPLSAGADAVPLRLEVSLRDLLPRSVTSQLVKRPLDASDSVVMTTELDGGMTMHSGGIAGVIPVPDDHGPNGPR
jgi:hypothetical protein